jgi:hypothetical protein
MKVEEISIGGRRLSTVPMVVAILALASCGNTNDPPSTAASTIGGHDASAVAPSDASRGAETDDATGAVEASGEDGGGDDADSGATPAAPPTQAFVRIADWAPDAPSAGFDVCLAPTGTTNWVGPLLADDLDAGTLGQGGANGIQFPWVTQYLGVSPGQYDLQLITAGSTDCTSGVIPVTMGLPTLALGSYTTFAAIGDVRATDNDPSMKIAAFSDDAAATSGSAALRFINATAAAAAVNVGTGDPTSGTFSEIFGAVEFGNTGTDVADGGSTDSNGYATVAPVSETEFSAQAVGTTTDIATAAHVTFAAGDVVTMALINGENGGLPPQFLQCTDNAAPSGGQTPCQVLIHE